MDRSKKDMSEKDFLQLSAAEIANISKSKTLNTVAFMMDGTRRMLKLSPGHEKDTWLYQEDYIEKLIVDSLNIAKLFYKFGVRNVVGPLISDNNLNREFFFPKGAMHLLNPLYSTFAKNFYDKMGVKVVFYGDCDSYLNKEGSSKVINIINKITDYTAKNKSRIMLIGIGFNTISEEKIICDLAIEYFKNKKKTPDLDTLKKLYYGVSIPETNIFIRTNEVRASGGFPSLLTGPRTQLYFPLSPGIISMDETAIRRILYDFLYQRVHSLGTHKHKKTTEKESNQIIKYYKENREEIIGIGNRIGDIWVHGKKA